ncbi:thiol:disulfide interchange protein TlpA [Oricola sp.]|uniref:thiol:disulfide interchange protein TlpA n=1 Tax=Oricola sp. TaxID=1979950 RepID=UPI003BA94DF7
MKKDTPESENGPATRQGPSIATIAAVAIGLGAVTGAAGIYAYGAHSGNAAGHATCSAAIAQGAELKPFLSGDVASMANRTSPNDLSGLAFNDPAGQPVTFADTGAKVRLVNLWATWCAPCREEMPALDRLQADKGGEAFDVVAISVDGGSDEKPRRFAEDIGLEHLAFYHDPTIGVFNTLKKEGLAFGLPVTLLVDENNCVIANMNGPADWASADAYRLIDAATAKN